MKDWQGQAHVKWDSKYHVVILPKYRRKVLYGRIRRGIGQILRDLCRQKNIDLVEGKAMPDHIHMLLKVPHRHSLAMTNGYLKGKVRPGSTGSCCKRKGRCSAGVSGRGVLRKYRRSGRRPDPAVHP